MDVYAYFIPAGLLPATGRQDERVTPSGLPEAVQREGDSGFEKDMEVLVAGASARWAWGLSSNCARGVKKSCNGS